MQRMAIDRKERRLYCTDPEVCYPIAIGTPQTPTPAGVFFIYEKEEKPQERWKDSEDIGARCLKLGKYDGDTLRPIGQDDSGNIVFVEDGETCYAIHGTDEPETIGQAVSKGCIRLRDDDIIRLFEWVNVGDRVVIV